MTKTSKKEYVSLKQVLCIHYPLRFRKNTKDIRALIDSSSKINAITPVYASKLGLWARHTNIKAQKIDGSILQIFKMALASFQVEDKLIRAQFF